MKILHLASFTGNIGDEANHAGFRRKFKENISEDCTFENLEIRNFYKSWDLMKFDDEFVKLVNNYDLLVIGGGNFFEFCWDYSATGTTLDITLDRLDKIKTPILINGMGVDDGKGVTESTIEKFGAFLEYIINSDRIIMSVRNDGSRKILNKYFSYLNLDKIYTIPDCGFFFRPKGNIEPVEINKEKVTIGINIAGDMLKTRFKNDGDFETFIIKFSQLLNNILNNQENINLVFYPHIYADLEIINSVLKNIDDRYRRDSISVAPLLHGKLDGAEYIFNSYSKCDLILGMRFHSNVCAIGQSIPNIGIVTYHKHEYLFEELNIKDRVVNITENVNKELFWSELEEKIIDSLLNKEYIRNRYEKLNQKLNYDIDLFQSNVKKILNI